MKLPRILITAMRSGAGKTMLTCGILKAMKMQEINPASFKCGPDYIDPMFHKTVIGISSYNLDSLFVWRKMESERSCKKKWCRSRYFRNGRCYGIL